MNELHEVVGRRIIEYRQKWGVSQEELAKLSGVSRVTISRIETGKTKTGIRLDTLQAICQALRLPPSSLFWDASTPGMTDHIDVEMLWNVAEAANEFIEKRWAEIVQSRSALLDKEFQAKPLPRLSLGQVEGVLQALSALGIFEPTWLIDPQEYFDDVQPCGHLRQAIVSSGEGTSYCRRCAEDAAAKVGNK